MLSLPASSASSASFLVLDLDASAAASLAACSVARLPASTLASVDSYLPSFPIPRVRSSSALSKGCSLERAGKAAAILPRGVQSSWPMASSLRAAHDLALAASFLILGSARTRPARLEATEKCSSAWGTTGRWATAPGGRCWGGAVGGVGGGAAAGEEEGEEDGVAVADASSCRAASTVVLSCASGAVADADAAAAALTRLGFDEVVQEEENERGECPCEDRGGDRGGDGDGGVEINDVAIAAAPPPRHPDSCLACIPAARERRQRRLRSCCCCCLEKNATSSRIDFSPPSKFFPV